MIPPKGFSKYYKEPKFDQESFFFKLVIACIVAAMIVALFSGCNTHLKTRFYIDEIMTAKFESGDPEFTSDFPSYLILNNAGNEYSEDYTEFIIRSVKVYQ